MLNQIFDFVKTNQQWLFPTLQFLVLFVFTLILIRNYKLVIDFLSTRSLIAYLLLRSFYLPLLALIYLSCFKLLFPYLVKYIPFRLTYIEFNSVYQVIVLAIFIWFVGRFTAAVKNYLLASDLLEGPLNDKIIYFVFELFYWTLILIFLLGSLHILQIEISPTLHVLGKGIIIWSFTLIFLYTVHVAVSENIRIFSEKGEFLASVIFKAISSPLLVVVFGVGFIFFIYMTRIGEYLAFPLTFRDIFIGSLFWALFRATSLIEEELLLGRLTRNYPDKTRVQTAGKLTRIGLMVVAPLFFFADKIHYAKSILVWVGGGSTFVIAFAAQTIIGNYLSGLVMYFEGNFKVGDWIYSTNKSIEGVVEYMGMRMTTLRTLDRRVLYVPNSFFSTANIVNATKMTNRRIDEIIPIERASTETMEKIINDIRAMLATHPDIDHYLSTMADLVEFGPSSLNINIRLFTKAKDLKTYRAVRQNIFLKVMEILNKYDVKLAPTHILPNKNQPSKAVLT